MAELVRLIEDSGAIKYGTFELSNGDTSNYYIDKYVFETQPEVLAGIADAISDQLAGSSVEVLAGPELGAVPLVTAVSLETGLPAAFIRDEAKGYGTDTRVEGQITTGQPVAIIEDVTTTGSTILETAQFIEAIGGVVERLIVVVDRNEGAVEHLHEHGFELEYLVQVGTDLDVGAPAE